MSKSNGLRTDYETRLVEHIRLCFTNPMIKDAKLICSVEGNLAMEATHIKRCILKSFPCAVFLGDQGNKDGVKTSEKTKHDMAMMLDSALRSESISIIREFVTTDNEPFQVLEKAKKQLLNYSRLTLSAKSPFLPTPTRFKFSGKGLNIKDKDDVAIVIQLAIYWSQGHNVSLRGA